MTDRGAELKTKRSELRLYCDMIMQQVHSIRSAASKGDATLDLDTDIEVSGTNGKVKQSKQKLTFLIRGCVKFFTAARSNH